MDYSTRTIDKVKVIELSGSFDRFSIQIVHQWLEEVTAMPPAFVVVNLSGVNLLDSSSLATLVHGLKKARAAGGEVRICCLQRSIRLLFEMTRMDRVFEIFLTETDAVQAFTEAEQPSQIPQTRYAEG
jgi:anti-sigma B factor antagonist